jgi:predicted O-linked N-acetylglucosamine transferase (SPINDLY family)
VSDPIDALLKSAFAHADAGRLAEAAPILLDVLRRHPDHPEALHELGMLHHRAGRTPQALELLARAADVAPTSFRYRFNLALMLLRDRQPARALPHLRQALDLAGAARDANMFDTIGSAFREAGALGEACDAYRQAGAIDPNFLAAHNRLGIALQEQGRLDEALQAFGRALQIDPDFPDANSNVLLCMTYHDRFSPQEIFAAHERVGRRLAAKSPMPRVSPTPRATGDGRPRIAYLSPDLGQHSVGFFIWPILANHDRGRVCVTCYADVASPDRVTAEFQRLTERWCDVKAMSDDELADRIAADGIDLLVDLAGHTAHNRQRLLARRVAPVQATYLGYPNTTGLPSMDFRVTDAVADPPGQTEALHTERLVRLPHAFFCYVTPTGFPDLTPLPSAQSGNDVTFAVLTNFAKIRPRMMELWTRILHARPRSRLLVQAKSLDDPQTRETTARFFAERGIDPRRIELRGWMEFSAYLRQFEHIDILLDTSPFCGHTGTCHALWMGVPMVTLAGATHRSRMGASILTQLALSDLIANTEDDYVRIAVERSNDTPRLAAIRADLRDRMLQSPIMNGPQFTRGLESAYEQMLGR